MLAAMSVYQNGLLNLGKTATRQIADKGVGWTDISKIE